MAELNGLAQKQGFKVEDADQEQLRMGMRVSCAACNTPFKSARALGVHVCREHDMDSEQYYVKFLHRVGDGLCPVCGDACSFLSILKGYSKHCSVRCMNKDTEHVSASRRTKLDRYGNACGDLEKSKRTRLARYGFSGIDIDKARKTKLERYGDAGHNNRSKAVRTCLRRYGVENVSQYAGFRSLMNDALRASFYSVEFRRKMERKGQWVPLNKLSAFRRYWLRVKSETGRWRKKVFSTWDGCDFYTGENIRSLPRQLITIDHRFSIKRGFDLGVPPERIGCIDNLCVCSKSVNSRKNYRTADEFGGMKCTQN